MEVVHVDDGLMELEHKIRFDGNIKHLLFYVDDGIKVDSIVTNICNIRKEFHREDLNNVLPYYYLGKCLPKNYLFISYSKNDIGGLNLSRIDQFSVKFNFERNNGGNIYIMSERDNILLNDYGYIIYRFNYSADCAKYEPNDELVDDVIRITI